MSDLRWFKVADDEMWFEVGWYKVLIGWNNLTKIYVCSESKSSQFFGQFDIDLVLGSGMEKKL